MLYPTFTDAPTDRVDTDRNTLPFPRGGVFGPHDATPTAPTTTAREADVAGRLLLRLDDMQRQLDELNELVDGDGDDWPPAAA